VKGENNEKYTIAAIIAFALIISMGQFASAEVSKEELKSISTPTTRQRQRRSLIFY
jgi:hypothetical protein